MLSMRYIRKVLRYIYFVSPELDVYCHLFKSFILSENKMCILFVHVNPDPEKGQYRLVLASNRDENYMRPTKPARQIENTNLIGGKGNISHLSTIFIILKFQFQMFQRVVE